MSTLFLHSTRIFYEYLFTLEIGSFKSSSFSSRNIFLGRNTTSLLFTSDRDQG